MLKESLLIIIKKIVNIVDLNNAKRKHILDLINQGKYSYLKIKEAEYIKRRYTRFFEILKSGNLTTSSKEDKDILKELYFVENPEISSNFEICKFNYRKQLLTGEEYQQANNLYSKIYIRTIVPNCNFFKR